MSFGYFLLLKDFTWLRYRNVMCYTDVALRLAIVSCGDSGLVNHACGKSFAFNRAVVALSAVALLRFVSCCVARVVYIVCACLWCVC